MVSPMLDVGTSASLQAAEREGKPQLYVAKVSLRIPHSMLSSCLQTKTSLSPYSPLLQPWAFEAWCYGPFPILGCFVLGGPALLLVLSVTGRMEGWTGALRYGTTACLSEGCPQMDVHPN